MKFRQLDLITDLEPGVHIAAIRELDPEEEYLKDHFPNFPVMPGVLMLEAMHQAANWLVRCSEDFAHAMVVLKEARSIKYADFVEPGETLTVTARILKQDERTTTLKTQGMVGDKVAVSGRLVLERYNMVDQGPQHQAADALMRRDMRREFDKLNSGRRCSSPTS